MGILTNSLQIANLKPSYKFSESGQNYLFRIKRMAIERDKFYRSESANKSFEVGFTEQNSQLKEYQSDSPENQDPFAQPFAEQNDGTYGGIVLEDQRVHRNPYAEPLNVLYVNGKVKEVATQPRNNEIHMKTLSTFGMGKFYKGRPPSKEVQIRRLNSKLSEAQRDTANNPLIPSFTILGKNTGQFDAPLNITRGERLFTSPSKICSDPCFMDFW